VAGAARPGPSVCGKPAGLTMPWSKLRYRLGLEQEQPPRYRQRREVPPAPPPPQPAPRFKRTTRDPFEQADLMRSELQSGRCSWAPTSRKKR
jgi:hypothetical protein